MSRRITYFILLTVWAILIASSVGTYLLARSMLLADLDEALLEQAVTRPELVLPAGWRARASMQLDDGDRYVIQHMETRRTLKSVVRPGEKLREEAPASSHEPRLLGASFSTRADGTRQRTITVETLARPATPEAAPTPVLVAYTGSAEEFHRVLARLALILSGCAIAGGVVAAALAWRVSRVALQPLIQTAATVGAIDERRLDRRIDAAQLPPELVPVAAKLNEMLARLEQAFAIRRQFLADASHELRTPVAALMTGLEVALARPRTVDAYKTCLTEALANATQLRDRVEGLMQQVRAESFLHDEPVEQVDLSALLDECTATAVELGRRREVRIERTYPADLQVRTQRGRLRSVVMNLLSNAVEYNRPGGSVHVCGRSCGRTIQLSIADEGRGIPPEHLPHLFQAFHRGARVQEPGHLGLGLFLVRTHLEVIGGKCEVKSDGSGTTFTVVLPLNVPNVDSGDKKRPQVHAPTPIDEKKASRAA